MKINIAVFFGGRSVEHEISVLSALQAINALDEAKYSVIPIYVTKQGVWYSGSELLEPANYKSIDSMLSSCKKVYMKGQYGDDKLYCKGMLGDKIYSKVDVILPMFHGTNGEDGSFQGLLEAIGLPYVGCDVLSSANGMDKITMKMILKESGVPIVDYIWFTDREFYMDKEGVVARAEALGYPLIVKPANLGSSVGISQATDRGELLQAIAEAEKFTTRIIVEKMVRELKEINCSVLGSADDNRASVCEEPLRSGEILSYKDKYLSGGKSSKGMQSTKRRIPADLPQETTQKIQFYAGETFRVLSCNGVSRIDFMIDGTDGNIYVNEINTIPGSLSFYLWEASGVSFSELMDKLVDLAIKRNLAAKMKTVSYSDNIFNLNISAKGGKA